MLTHKSLTRVAALMVAIGSLASSVFAGVDPPALDQTRTRYVLVSNGPPKIYKIYYDPWTTFAASPGTFSAFGVRLPTAVVNTVNEVVLVQTGTDTVISQFGWAVDPDTKSDIDVISPPGAGNTWFGYSSGLSGAVSAGISADFRVEVTLQAGKTLEDLHSALAAASVDRAFSDAAIADGSPNNTHRGIIDLILTPGLAACCGQTGDACTDGLTQVECEATGGTWQGAGTTCVNLTTCVPTISQWGLVAMGGLLMGAACAAIRRRKLQTSPAA